MVSRTVIQLYDNVLRPSGLQVTQVSILATIAPRWGEPQATRVHAAEREPVRRARRRDLAYTGILRTRSCLQDRDIAAMLIIWTRPSRVCHGEPCH